jgi:tetratricopeptide (TPR) repeat protein
MKKIQINGAFSGAFKDTFISSLCHQCSPGLSGRLVTQLDKRVMPVWLVRIQCTMALLGLAIVSSACASHGVEIAQRAPAPAPVQSTPAPELQPEAQASAAQGVDPVIELRVGALPHVPLTANILYRVLAADIAAQRGAFLPAGTTFLELARETADPRFAKRAVELFAAAGDLRGALDSARVWVANAPYDQEALATSLALSAAAGQTEGLVNALAGQVRSASDKTEALALAMGVLSRMPDRSVAVTLMQDVITEGNVQGTLAAYMAMADMAQAAGDYPRALEQARLAMRLKPDSEDAAMRVLDYGMPVDAAQAIEDGRRFARTYPKSRQLRLMLSGKLADQGDVQAALAELKLMSTQFPEDFDLLFIRAQLAYRDRRIDEAQKLLHEYVAVQSQRQEAVSSGASDAGAALADAYTLLSRIAQDQGELDRAIEWLGRIDDPGARYSSRLRQATIRAEQGRVDEAVKMIEAALPADQDEELIGVLTTTQILRRAERYDQAIELLRAADQSIEGSVEIKYELSMLLERQGNLPDMERYLRQVIEIDPGYAHAYNALGYSLADRNLRLDEAYELILRAHQILPKDPYILDSLGLVKFRQGDYELAYQYLLQAFDIKPEAEIAAHLGEVLWVLGRQNEAREVWQQGVILDSTNKTLVQTMQRFGVSP